MEQALVQTEQAGEDVAQPEIVELPEPALEKVGGGIVGWSL